MLFVQILSKPQCISTDKITLLFRSLYRLYPGRSPPANTTEYEHARAALGAALEPGEGWGAASQAYAQLEALVTTLAVAICGGLATGERAHTNSPFQQNK